MKNSIKIVAVLCLVFAMKPVIAFGETSNTPYGWGFKKGKNEIQADAGWQYEALLKQHGAVYKGSPNEKVLYLTFDNGYENGYTEGILDILKKEKVPAAFFVTGHYLESAPEQVERMAADGHIIGNHSWHHPDMTVITDNKIKEELELVRAKSEELTGRKKMAYLRPPRGIFSERTMEIAKQSGYTHVFWSLAYVDWNINAQKGWQYSYNNIMQQVHPGAVLLLHTVSKDNADALEKVIQDLKAKGYKFKSLDHLTKQQKAKK